MSRRLPSRWLLRGAIVALAARGALRASQPQLQQATWHYPRPDEPAPRCEWCGWSLPGVGPGIRDPKFTGHHPACPSLFQWIKCAQDLHDHRIALMHILDIREPFGDGSMWIATLNQALNRRADQLNLP